MEHLQEIWPTIKSLADDIGVPYSTAHSWLARGRIPASRDFELIEAAARRGKTLTLEQLALSRAASVREGAEP